MAQPPVKSLIEVALPFMRRLADETDQSCHVAVRVDGDIVVAVRMESAGLIGFSVRVGYRQPIVRTGSGTVLYAFQSEGVQKRWEADFDDALTKADLTAFRSRAKLVREQGHDLHPSELVPGIVDLSAPLMRGDSAAAALTMPYVEKRNRHTDIPGALAKVRAVALEISSELATSDVRV